MKKPPKIERALLDMANLLGTEFEETFGDELIYIGLNGEIDRDDLNRTYDFAKLFYGNLVKQGILHLYQWLDTFAVVMPDGRLDICVRVALNLSNGKGYWVNTFLRSEEVSVEDLSTVE